MVKLARHLHTQLPAELTTGLRSQVEANLVEQAATFDPVVLRRLGNHVLEQVAPGCSSCATKATRSPAATDP